MDAKKERTVKTLKIVRIVAVLVVVCLNSIAQQTTDTMSSETVSKMTEELNKAATGIGDIMAGLAGISTNTTSLPIHLQIDRSRSGISVNEFLGMVTTSADSYTNTAAELSYADLRAIVVDSASSGHKPRHSLSMIGKDWSADEKNFAMVPQSVLFGVHVSSSLTTNPLPIEIRKRFELAPPLVLDIWLDGRAAYVDVKNGTSAAMQVADFPVNIQWKDRDTKEVIFSIKGGFQSEMSPHLGVAYTARTNLDEVALCGVELECIEDGKPYTLEVDSRPFKLTGNSGIIEADRWEFGALAILAAQRPKDGKGRLRFALFRSGFQNGIKRGDPLSDWIEMRVGVVNTY